MLVERLPIGVSDDIVICVCCEKEAVVFVDLENMNFKGFGFCKEHFETVLSMYQHGESVDMIKYDD